MRLRNLKFPIVIVADKFLTCEKTADSAFDRKDEKAIRRGEFDNHRYIDLNGTLYSIDRIEILSDNGLWRKFTRSGVNYDAELSIDKTMSFDETKQFIADGIRGHPSWLANHEEPAIESASFQSILRSADFPELFDSIEWFSADEYTPSKVSLSIKLKD